MFFHEEKEGMSAQIVIDQEECLGCEACVESCPEVFAIREDDGKAYVLEGADPSAGCIEDAIASCPGECITLE